MKKKRILISDIAKNLGVSVTTVSFILNGKAKEKRISERMTKRVLDYVQRVGYKPNQLAQSLRTGQTKTIAFLVGDISNPFFTNVAKHLETLADAQGYHLLYSSLGEDAEKAKNLIRLFYDRQIDGLILTPKTGLEDIVGDLLQKKVPLVLFDRYLPGINASCVVSDNLDAAYKATRHLLQDSANRRVGFVASYSNQTHMRDRLAGYMKALDEFQRQAYIRKIHRHEDRDVAAELIREFVEENRLDAVFYASNYLGIAGLKVARKIGRMPATVVFDDHILFKMHEPPVTAIAQDIPLMAEELIKALLKQIKDTAKEPKKVVVRTQMKWRDSSRRD